MLNIAICDDDALHGRHTAAQISVLDGFAAAKLGLFTSADNLIYAITEDNYAVDIAVLDIQMESMDGIELAKRINELAPECQVIFLSGHIEYASKVYDAEHVFFVLKSQSETYLKGALEKAMHRRESAKANYIVITNGANAQRIPWDRVQYLERVLRRTRVVAADGEYWTSAAPKELVAGLDEAVYCRCHNSYYVNTACLAAMLPGEFILKSGAHIPISRSLSRQAKETFLFAGPRFGG